MKAMNAAHRPRIAWTMGSMFDNDDDINYLTASMVLSFILSRCPGWRHVALQDVRRHLALTEEEKMDVIESVEGEAYTVKPQSIANEGDLVIIPQNFTIIPPAVRMADGRGDEGAVNRGCEGACTHRGARAVTAICRASDLE